MSKRNDNPEEAPEKRKFGFLRLLKYTVLSILVVGLCLVGFGIAYMLGIDAYDKLDPQKILAVDQSTTVYDVNGTLISTVHGLENRTWVDVHTLPEHVKMAFVAAEDARFYSHAGVDVKRIFGALWADIKAGGAVQGASTITQQLIKNSHLNPEKTLSRKIEEALMALELERRYSKDEILEMYLNYIYFGAGAYGVEAAAQTYFSVEAKDLSLAQAATLAGILKSPTNYAPHLQPDNSKGRRNVVLDLMADYGYATSSDVSTAKQDKLELNMREKNNEFGWYMDAALEIAAEKANIDYDNLISGGYKVYTAMNPDIQRLCNRSFENGELFPENASDGSQPQSALVIMNPGNGYVSAMVGGREYTVQRGLNRALNLRRQPGSTIKPIMVYAPALKSGRFTAASILIDEPKTYENPHEIYEPKNFGGKYYGEVTLREAVTKSLNIPAVEVLNQIGLRSGKRFAQSAGITFDVTDNGLSLALGGFSKGVSPLELCAGYASFAGGGVYHEPVIVTHVENAEGVVIYRANNADKEILDAEDTFILTDMLQDVVNVGTGRRMDVDIPLAGKTGTNGYGEAGNRDAWMAAYNSDYAAVVWMGYDNTDDIHCLPASCTGGTFPALLLNDVFTGIYEGGTAPDFVHPANVTKVRLDRDALRNDQLVLARSNASEGSYIEEYIRSDQVPAEPTPTPQPLSYGFYDFSARLNEYMQPEISFKASSALGKYGVFRIDDGQKAAQIATLTGDSEYAWIDNDAEAGKGYTYYIASLNSSGMLSGKQSDKVYILVMDYGTGPIDTEPTDGFGETEPPYPTAMPDESETVPTPGISGISAATPGASGTPLPTTIPSNMPVPTDSNDGRTQQSDDSGHDETGIDDILDGYEDEVVPNR